MVSKIFRKKELRREIAAIEFRYFLSSAETVIETHKSRSTSFSELDQAYSFHLTCEDNHLQASFEKRKLAYLNLEGDPDVECGTRLVYSLNPTGIVGCLLYPARNPVSDVQESLILLRTGQYSSFELQKRLKRDLKLLETYLFVSSPDLSASLLQRMRIFWIRTLGRLQKKGDVSKSRLFLWFYSGAIFILGFLFETLLTFLFGL
ncbi:hypothetical protein [Celeribacter sp. ULVN23_4]